MVIYFRLCKAGYAGSILEARQLGAREVLQALHYEKFLSDYEQSYLDLHAKTD